MRFGLISLSSMALAMSLSACGGNDVAENNVVAEDLNAMANLEELPPAEPEANAAAEAPAETPEPESAKPAAPTKPAPAKPAPAPAPKPAEPAAPPPACTPEHRAAGHC